ncbi:hypothetical protein CTI14_54465, partial [Methylobacterium radiotolerans]
RRENRTTRTCTTIYLEPDDLVGRAQALIGSLIPLDAAVYYEQEGGRWFVKRMLGEYGNAELRRAHQQGLPHATTMNLRTPFETGEPYYQDMYDDLPGTRRPRRAGPGVDRQPDS